MKNLQKFANYYGAECFLEKQMSETWMQGIHKVDSNLLAALENDHDFPVKLYLKELSEITNEDCIKFVDTINEELQLKAKDDKIAYVKSLISHYKLSGHAINCYEADTFRSLGYAIGLSKDLYVVKPKKRCSRCFRPTHEWKCVECKSK